MLSLPAYYRTSTQSHIKCLLLLLALNTVLAGKVYLLRSNAHRSSVLRLFDLCYNGVTGHPVGWTLHRDSLLTGSIKSFWWLVLFFSITDGAVGTGQISAGWLQYVIWKAWKNSLSKSQFHCPNQQHKKLYVWYPTIMDLVLSAVDNNFTASAFLLKIMKFANCKDSKKVSLKLSIEFFVVLQYVGGNSDNPPLCHMQSRPGIIASDRQCDNFCNNYSKLKHNVA